MIYLILLPQLVQYEQYRALFEGYLAHQWSYYAAVLLWKSQSPWPALRGGLYDPYLETNGGYWGALISHPISLPVRNLYVSLQLRLYEHAAMNTAMNAVSVYDILFPCCIIVWCYVPISRYY